MKTVIQNAMGISFIEAKELGKVIKKEQISISL